MRPQTNCQIHQEMPRECESWNVPTADPGTRSGGGGKYLNASFENFCSAKEICQTRGTTWGAVVFFGGQEGPGPSPLDQPECVRRTTPGNVVVAEGVSPCPDPIHITVTGQLVFIWSRMILVYGLKLLRTKAPAAAGCGL